MAERKRERETKKRGGKGNCQARPFRRDETETQRKEKRVFFVLMYAAYRNLKQSCASETNAPVAAIAR